MGKNPKESTRHPGHVGKQVIAQNILRDKRGGRACDV